MPIYSFGTLKPEQLYMKGEAVLYLYKLSTKGKQVKRNNTAMVAKDLKQNFHPTDLPPTKLVPVLTEAELARANQLYPVSVFKIRTCKTNAIVSYN